MISQKALAHSDYRKLHGDTEEAEFNQKQKYVEKCKN